jgi:hypothetical protein
MQVQLWIPCELKPTACVVLRSAHIGGYEKSFVLGEELCLPMAIDGIRGIHKAICDRPAAGKINCAGFVLAITSFDSRAGREPVAGATLNRTAVTTDGVAKQEALVRIAIDVLTIDEIVCSAVVMRKAFRADCFDAQIHMLQKR